MTAAEVARCAECAAITANEQQGCDPDNCCCICHEPPLDVERAADLARRGFQPIDIDVWAPDPERPGLLKHVRRRTPREVCRLLTDVLGTEPEGGEEGLHVFPSLNHDCASCPTNHGRPMCTKYDDHYELPRFERGGCRRHTTCQRFTATADTPWPVSGRLTVFSVRGSSEGDYVHVEQGGELILLAKTFAGRDAAWTLARRLADLLGV